MLHLNHNATQSEEGTLQERFLPPNAEISTEATKRQLGMSISAVPVGGVVPVQTFSTVPVGGRVGLVPVGGRVDSVPVGGKVGMPVGVAGKVVMPSSQVLMSSSQVVMPNTGIASSNRIPASFANPSLASTPNLFSASLVVIPSNFQTAGSDLNACFCDFECIRFFSLLLHTRTINFYVSTI